MLFLAKNKIIIILLLININVFSQKFFRISYTRFGSLKTYEIFCNENMEYKLKGDIKYHVGKIVNIQDSFIVLKDTTVIKISQIKAIKIRKNNRLISILSGVIITAGVGFTAIDTGNNLINNQHPALNNRAVAISIPLIVVGLLIKQIGIKRIRINKNKCIKTFDLKYDHLNSK